VIRIAVIADPHVHDRGWAPAGSGLGRAIRSYGETAASTRVFNESLPAFRAALDRAVAEGARLALLVGDLTDDGQAPNIEAAMALFRDYRARHGLRVLATPGNHDFYALAGRPQVKTFLADDGAPIVVDSAAVPEAATLGTAAALGRMADLGSRPAPGDLLWETPFGTDPDFAARSYEARSPDGSTRCAMIDGSYLVEPVEGLWVLSLDANVCVPRDGARDLSDPASFHDPTSAGWPAVLRHRAHLLGWMTRVAARARAAGKRLVAFSHYPALDPLGGMAEAEIALFGATGLARRAPPAEVARAFAATGVEVHFSGHLHVNDTARHDGPEGRFLNIAVPSPVGFPPAIKIADVAGQEIRIRTLPLDRVPGHDAAFAAYRAEAARSRRDPPPAAFAADHGAFMDHHLRELVEGRYMAREWPRDMVAFVAEHRLEDLVRLVGLAVPETPDAPLSAFVEDWYRLRKGGEAGAAYVPADRLSFYRRLPAIPPGQGEGLAARFAELLRMLRGYLNRPPNGDFTISWPELEVTRL
jgi:3',5'-cyclic AMP phosphodiesterase CpdA